MPEVRNSRSTAVVRISIASEQSRRFRAAGSTAKSPLSARAATRSNSSSAASISPAPRARVTSYVVRERPGAPGVACRSLAITVVRQASSAPRAAPSTGIAKDRPRTAGKGTVCGRAAESVAWPLRRSPRAKPRCSGTNTLSTSTVLLPVPFMPTGFQSSSTSHSSRGTANTRALDRSLPTVAVTNTQSEKSTPLMDGQRPDTCHPPGTGSALPLGVTEPTITVSGPLAQTSAQASRGR